jgi:hypothetical protein
MASVLEKIELLQAVGAGKLADQVLTNIMQGERERLQQAQQRLPTELAQCKRTSQVSSQAMCSPPHCLAQPEKSNVSLLLNGIKCMVVGADRRDVQPLGQC